jgi:hypothetical protein
VKQLLLACVAAALLSIACSQGTRLRIVNQSDVSLTDVLVSGSGFSEAIGRIAPHAEHRLVVRPTRESALRLRFIANGKPVSFGPAGYFERGDRSIVIATVSPDLAVSVTSEPHKY